MRSILLALSCLWPLVGCGDPENSSGGSGAGGSEAGGGARASGGASSAGAGDTGTGGVSEDPGDPGPSCTGQADSCSDTPFGLCVNVQSEPGHCIDLSLEGATPCAGDPSECPTDVPTVSLPGESNLIVACVAEDATMQFGGALAPDDPQPGYCVATLATRDPDAEASCDPNPCGDGYCSSLVNQLGESVVSCTWPL